MPPRVERKTTLPSRKSTGWSLGYASTNAATLGASAASLASCSDERTVGSLVASASDDDVAGAGVETAGEGDAERGAGGAEGAGAGAPAQPTRRADVRRKRRMRLSLVDCRHLCRAFARNLPPRAKIPTRVRFQAPSGASSGENSMVKL